MEAKAITRYIRISPRKMRLVLDQVRFKSLPEAYQILSVLKKKAAHLITKTLKSAEANARVKKMDETRLYIRDIRADGGPSLKRYMSRSMGRADVILKRFSHLSIELAEHERKLVPVKDRAQEGLKGQTVTPKKRSKVVAASS